MILVAAVTVTFVAAAVETAVCLGCGIECACCESVREWLGEGVSAASGVVPALAFYI